MNMIDAEEYARRAQARHEALRNTQLIVYKRKGAKPYQLFRIKGSNYHADTRVGVRMVEPLGGFDTMQELRDWVVEHAPENLINLP